MSQQVHMPPRQRQESAEAATGAPRAQRRGDIQGMRAVAVLSVMLSHAEIVGFAGGYVGVDVFFVISGFLITGILAREVTKSGRVSITGFYSRRALRILPAATVALLVVCLVSLLVYTTNNLHLVLQDIGAAALFSANIDFALAGTDYFSTSAFVSPVQHFWSLAVEEQFYLVWPAVIGLIMYLGARARGASGSSRPATRAVALRRSAALVLLLALLSFWWSVHRTGTNPQMAYYSTFTRTWELSVGALLALSAGRIARLPAAVKGVASWAGLLAIAVAVLTFSSATPFPGWHAALPVVGAALVLGGGIDGPRAGARLLLDTRPMRFVGNISYSLYLWHWPLLILPGAYLVRDLGLLERLLALAASVLLAWASYRWVETPFHHPAKASAAAQPEGGAASRADVRGTARARRRSVNRSLLLWPAAVAMVLAGVAGVWAYDASRTGGSAAALPASNSAPETPQQLIADVARASALARQNAPLATPLVPALPDLFGDITHPMGTCSASREALTVDICPSGDTKASRTIVLWGDSHIGMWMRPLEQLAKERGYRIVPFTKASCVPLDEVEWYRGKAYPECRKFGQWALDQIARLKPDHILISGFLGTPLVNEAGTGPLQVGQDTERFTAGAQRMLSKVHSRLPGTTVTVFSDVSILDQDAGKCLGSKRATMGTCVKPMSSAVASRNSGWKSATAATGARYLDLLPYFCAETCPIVVGNTIVYRDSNHITSTYAQRLKPVLGKELGL
ncbi:acyltransferase family protein [Terrabacter sp. 2RAF25]|uniref:acyltransferase family protein n=1 Tax=Terrabacter sp. 2RAF25 TaxID=3232998 RepID=UPI003F95182F